MTVLQVAGGGLYGGLSQNVEKKSAGGGGSGFVNNTLLQNAYTQFSNRTGNGYVIITMK